MTHWTPAQYAAYKARQRTTSGAQRPATEVGGSQGEAVDGRRLEVIIPGRIHPSLNQLNRMYWTERAAEKQSWEVEIITLVEDAGWKSEPLRRARVRIYYYCGDRRRRDKDNHNPKAIMDGLVMAGVLADDNAQDVHVDWQLLPDGPRRTEILIEEVRSGA